MDKRKYKFVDLESGQCITISAFCKLEAETILKVSVQRGKITGNWKYDKQIKKGK